jgi:hypothetical protein
MDALVPLASPIEIAVVQGIGQHLVDGALGHGGPALAKGQPRSLGHGGHLFEGVIP